MLILAASDTIAGGASVASQLTCTLFGMELNASSGAETYKVLDQRQLASSPATIYTATANGPTFVRSIAVVNNDTSARTFQLFRGGTAAANAITPVASIVAGGMAVYEEGVGWRFYSAAGVELVSPFAGNFPTVIGDNLISGYKAENIPRSICTETNTTGPTTGQIFMAAIYLYAGTVVSNIAFACATTAGGTITHWVYGLYDSSGNLLATTADQTSTAFGANTVHAKAVNTPYTVPTSGVYYLAFMMTATTMPTLKGNTACTDGALRTASPSCFGLSATTYSTGTAPATVSMAWFGTKVTWSIWCGVS